MSRCIVFDQATAKAVESRSGIRPEIRAGQADVIRQLAWNAGAGIALLPAGADTVLLLRISHPPMTEPARVSSNLAPAGFLGLTDSIDLDSEPQQPKKWWQKILD